MVVLMLISACGITAHDMLERFAVPVKTIYLNFEVARNNPAHGRNRQTALEVFKSSVGQKRELRIDLSLIRI